MTLQELIGELLTLSNAYPAETPVHTVIPSHGYSDEIIKVEVSRPLIERHKQVIAKREADNVRITDENARLNGEVEALTALLVATLQ